MNIRREEGAVTQRAVPGPALYFLSSMPEGAPRAVVGILHGYADHAARYTHVMDTLAARGIGVVALDVRGHGRAMGQRGFCRRFDEFLDDAAELERLVADRSKGAPRFLLGHSFGGLVATLSMLQGPSDYRGLVLSSPFLERALEIPRVKLVVGSVASRVIPRLSLPSGLTGSMVTHDAERARAYDNDPLAFKTVTARWFQEAERTQQVVLASAGAIKMPVYALVGGADPVAKVATTKAFFGRLGSEDKTWDERDGYYHETMNEVDWRPVVASVGDWILAHAG